MWDNRLTLLRSSAESWAEEIPESSTTDKLSPEGAATPRAQCRPTGTEKLDENQKTREGRIQSFEATVVAGQSCNHQLEASANHLYNAVWEETETAMATYRWRVPNYTSSTAALRTLLAEAFSARSLHFLAESQLEKLLSFFPSYWKTS